MAYAAISKPSLHFNTNLHTGTGSTQQITTGLNMSANGGMVWNKSRSASNNHIMWDTIRTATKSIYPDLNAAEATEATSLTAFTTTGWTGGGTGNTNANGTTFVSWNWLAGSSHSGSSNNDGSITSTVSANTTAGFSIVKYTGADAVRTVGHGLGVKPNMIIIKRLDSTGNWEVYHSSLGATKYVHLNANGSAGTSAARWNDTEPTSSVFTLSTSANVNANGNYIAYCFAEKKGYSKFGSYTGNGNADGPFIYTGFKPAFVIFKVTNDNDNWHMHDDKRTTNGGNPLNKVLYPNLNNSEGSVDIDFLSNGFKPRSNNNAFNASGKPYIYMAFAAEPLVANVGNSIPATAR
jgi:hypothetical protein